MELPLNYDILKYLHEIRSDEVLDGRIQVMAELIQQGHIIVLNSKKGILFKVVRLASISKLEEFIEFHLPGWKPTKHYLYL